MRRNSGRRAAACLAVLAVAASGCGQLVRGTGSYSTSKSNVSDADTPIKNLPNGKKTDVDVIAGNAIADIETYWKQTFPTVFDGKQYSSPKGGYYSVDPSSDTADVPCVDSPSEIRGNAFYCPPKDIVAWDRVELFPTLKKEFSEFLIAMVLAHEWGHVIQTKSGVDPDRTIVRETQADCYAGGWTKWALAGDAPHFQIDQSELDTALAGYLLFRDPVGSDANDQDAHGSGFDRISAFQEGFEQGPAHCATFDDDRKFTEIQFTPGSADEERGGNLPLDDDGDNQGAITLGLFDLDGTWPDLAKQLGVGGSFTKPQVKEASQGDADCGGQKVQQGVQFCADSNTIFYSREALGKVSSNTKDSDYAPMTLLGLAYAQSVLKQDGKDPSGQQGLVESICLDGAYTSQTTTREQSNETPLTLSPGDLDEAIQALLFYAGTDAFFGANGTTGFERISAYRQGFNDPKSCVS